MTLSDLAQRKRYPTFSFVMTRTDGSSVVIKDLQPARRRVVRFDDLPTPPSPAYPADNSYLMRTVDMRREGDLAYRVVYEPEYSGDEDDDDDINTFDDDEDMKMDVEALADSERGRPASYTEALGSALRIIGKLFCCCGY